MGTQQLTKVKGIPILPSLPPWLAFTQGKFIHCKPYTVADEFDSAGSSDSNDGLTPETAVKTLTQALSIATADQNDIVLLYSQSNTASKTTDYQSATLDWNKDGVHLIGVNSGSLLSQRSRVAFASAYATASNLFTLSADNCYLANISFFAGVASTNPTGCMKVTGTRNRIENCNIAGIGNDANDIAGAYSLWLSAAAENVFKDCVIGLGTIDAGTAANREIYVSGSGNDDNQFIDCIIHRRIEHATNHPLVELAAATNINAGRFLLFKKCLFFNASTNYAVAQSGQFSLPVLTSGDVIVWDCMGTSGTNTAANTKWDVNDRDRISVIGPATPAADTPNLDRRV